MVGFTHPTELILGPIKATTTCLRKSFDFSGRATRAEFWWFAPVVIIFTALWFSSDRIMTMFPLHFGVLGSILVVLFVVPFPLYAVSVRRFRDAGHWAWFPTLLPIWVVIGPFLAISLDQSSIGIGAKTRGMPELMYAIFGYLALCLAVMAGAVWPSRNAFTPARDNEVTP